MDVTFDHLVTLTPVEGGGEALVCGPDGCAPASDPEPPSPDNG